ncbi:uracil-DNA glycosylase [Paraferrimonas haliotis]|uniref:Uracil-DNA glycosylase n=1 Tax=Paraferrimonas haliotis TaxID=2013866 RepID=A0AA37TQW4_9GAMM|nr:uracil-DNA glycosylase [Paraferrimonas haliotis]
MQQVAHSDWADFIRTEIEQEYMQSLLTSLEQRRSQETIFPDFQHCFNAFRLTAFRAIKVVIIGQDPYFNPGQAMGLSFSVPNGTKLPPSLRNIYKELQSDLAIEMSDNGDLTHWAEQGVFLLNASLTVTQGQPGSHLKLGWQTFTQRVIEYINRYHPGAVFLSWGAFAHKLCRQLDTTNHSLIKTSHPSPLGARRSSASAPAFIGSRCFSLANQLLAQRGLSAIDWQPQHSVQKLL